MEIGILGTEMQVALAGEDLAAAEAINNKLSSVSSNLESGRSYYGLWCSHPQVKWLYRIGRAETGVQLAVESIPDIKRTADRNLLERMQLLAADGLGRTGRAAEGSALLAEAVNANPDPPLEMIAEAARVAGRLTAAEDPGAATGHFERAASILEKIGNVTARADVQRDALETLKCPRPTMVLSTSGSEPENRAGEPAATRRLADHRPSAAPFTERLATLLELGAHPLLLATETLSLIGDTGSVVHAALVEKHPDGRRELITAYSAPASPSAIDDDPHAVRIPVGTRRDREVRIVAIPHPTASARTTLLSVEQLVHAALTIARGRQENREPAALWPTIPRSNSWAWSAPPAHAGPD